MPEETERLFCSQCKEIKDCTVKIIGASQQHVAQCGCGYRWNAQKDRIPVGVSVGSDATDSEEVEEARASAEAETDVAPPDNIDNVTDKS